MAWTIENQIHTHKESLDCYDEYISYLTEQKYKAYQEMREYDLRLTQEKALRQQCLEKVDGLRMILSMRTVAV